MSRKPEQPTRRTTAKKVQSSEDEPILPELDAKPEADEDGWDNDGLTIKQRLFVEAITGPAAGNATKAAKLAGYRSDNRVALAATAYENLRKPHVAKAIALALAKRRLTPEWVQNRLADIANADMNNFLSLTDSGMLLPDYSKAVALGALGQMKEYDPETGKIKVHDPSRALNTLAKMFGMLKENIDITSGGKTIKAFVDIDDGDDD